MAVHGLSVCAGIGGLDLALSAAIPSYRTVGYVERGYPAAVLVARMGEGRLDTAPIWDSVETFDGRRWRGTVDIIAAGWPCQGFSTATRGRPRQEDLWPQVERIIGECAPTTIFLENVVTAPWVVVATSLRSLGYRVAVGRVCPSELGSPARRPRIYLVAHAHSEGECWCSVDGQVAGVPALATDLWSAHPRTVGEFDGAPYRMDRLRAAGNSVVWQAAALAFASLWEEVK